MKTPTSISQTSFSNLQRREIGLVAALAMLLFSLLACGWLPQAPMMVQPTPLPELAFEIVEMPETLCLGSVATFVVKTMPGNECFASVRYQYTDDSLTGENLESMLADEEGVCEWSWKVARNAIAGIAVFKTGVEGYGSVEASAPQPFMIIDCSQ